MQVITNPKVRKAIYVIATVLTPTVGYLNQADVVGEFAFGLYMVVMTAVTGLAALNTDTKE